MILFRFVFVCLLLLLFLMRFLIQFLFVFPFSFFLTLIMIFVSVSFLPDSVSGVDAVFFDMFLFVCPVSFVSDLEIVSDYLSNSVSELEYCLTDCTSGKSLMFSDSWLELRTLMKEGKTSTLFQSSSIRLGHSVSLCGLSDLTRTFSLAPAPNKNAFAIGSLQAGVPPLLRIDLSPDWKDLTSVVETSDIGEFHVL